MKLISCYSDNREKHVLFSAIPANFSPRTFLWTFQELSSTKFIFFHLLFVGTDFNILNNLEIMLEVLNLALRTVWDEAPIVKGSHQSQCINTVTGGDTVYKRYES